MRDERAVPLVSALGAEARVEGLELECLHELKGPALLKGERLEKLHRHTGFSVMKDERFPGAAGNKLFR
jgi:hypothetical protein